MDQRRKLIGAPETVSVPRPQLIAALRAGFDAIANHIYLIILPLLMDLFIWLGPHFSLKQLLDPFVKELADLPGMSTPDAVELLNMTRQAWQSMANQLNLAAALRTYPIGLPSLMAGELPHQTPLGAPSVIQVSSIGNAFLWFVLFSLVGVILGGVYFNQVSRALFYNTSKTAGDAPKFTWGASQAVLLALIWIGLLLVVSIPAVLLITIVAMISAPLAQLFVLLMSVALVWVIVPLLFSPHGIYVYRQDALHSILTSVRLVRYVLSGTGLFWLAVIVLSQGLDLLWEVPPSTSWLSLVAIAGHAFVTTSLLAASFVYYHDAMQWVRNALQRSLVQPKRTVSG